ncbi:MAG: UbiD family decarboxylase domain-containing protein [Pseudomonadota bacterium]|nr:UbiD family decarboxylase domain-containing protein [Pseudomonadota bacterium]
MKKMGDKDSLSTESSRRDFLLGGTGLAALATTASCSSISSGLPGGIRLSSPESNSGIKAPFKDMRDYIAALEDYGLVVRIPRADQDAYEIAALTYRLRDQHGMRGGPCLLIEEVKIDGKWIKGPLLVNESGNAHAECITLGLDPVEMTLGETVPYKSYVKARDRMEKIVQANGGVYPSIDPIELNSAAAPCKEIVLIGNEVDLTKFAFIKCNPADAGRYINTGSVFTKDPRRGINFGTYRCHLRGPREIAINSEPGQTGYRHLMAARDRGETVANVSIALTVDPYFWEVSSSKMVYRGGGADELSLAGGLAGRALEVVKSETNDILVPANAEIIIEGEVPLDDLRPEGPYGEMVGYQGRRKAEVFWMKVTAVTHRKDPWIMNNFTGLQNGSMAAAGHAGALYALKKEIPSVIDFYSDNRTVGMSFVSIRKTKPGEGLEIAKKICKDNFFAKVVVVVDEDLDVMNQEHMLMAMGTRWQPFGNTEVFEKLPAMPLDPSTVQIGRGSKIAIDATRQWPEEGGPERFPELNRTLLETIEPDAFANVDQKYGDLIKNWSS